MASRQLSTWHISGGHKNASCDQPQTARTLGLDFPPTPLSIAVEVTE
jgi:hypothetical protein